MPEEEVKSNHSKAIYKEIIKKYDFKKSMEEYNRLNIEIFRCKTLTGQHQNPYGQKGAIKASKMNPKLLRYQRALIIQKLHKLVAV